jgi:hypothetical protein
LAARQDKTLLSSHERHVRGKCLVRLWVGDWKNEQGYAAVPGVAGHARHSAPAGARAEAAPRRWSRRLFISLVLVCRPSTSRPSPPLHLPCPCVQAKHISTIELASALEDADSAVLLLDARMKEEVIHLCVRHCFFARQRFRYLTHQLYFFLTPYAHDSWCAHISTTCHTSRAHTGSVKMVKCRSSRS